MSTRIIFFSSPNRNSATDFASSVLPTPVGPRNSSTPSGRSNPSFKRALVQHQPARHGADRFALSDHAVAKLLLDVAEPIRYVAEHHVLGNPRDLGDDVDDVVAGDFPAPADLGADGGGVEPADDLVRQLQVPHVARRHLERRLDRFVLDAHRVVALEARPQVVEDRARLLDRRLDDVDGAEAARQRLVFLDELLVLAAASSRR